MISDIMLLCIAHTSVAYRSYLQWFIIILPDTRNQYLRHLDLVRRRSINKPVPIKRTDVKIAS